MRNPIVLTLSFAGVLAAGATSAQPLGASPNAAPMAPSVSPGPAPRPYGMFARMDRDGDGKVTAQEFVAFQDAIFDQIDAAHAGRITKADVDAFIAREEAAKAGRMMRGKGGGAGGGGTMLAKLSERLGADGALTKPQWEAMAARHFNRLDTARLGYLTPDTLHRAPMENGATSDPTQ